MKSFSGIILIDLPTFPKGTLALSLVNVASCLKPHYPVHILDLNFINPDDFFTAYNFQQVQFFGLKVSSQNVKFAEELTAGLKSKYQGTPVVWGGELPTLLPDFCLQHAHTIVSGLFEPVAVELVEDLKQGTLKQRYYGGNDSNLDDIPLPDFSLLDNTIAQYYSFMGLPMETSRGCTEKCAFCMVHQMQKKNYNLKSGSRLHELAACYQGSFVNIVDYNFGVDKEHVKQTGAAFKAAGVKGWMAEMCIELLDDDEVLQALKDSGCRMIYCGLESIDEAALSSVHKMNTNHIENYERIIRKAQSYGIQIAAGVILGIQNTNENTFRLLYDFFTRLGIIYVKLTFLTYNPGTKVKKYMARNGEFTTEEIALYDGNHLTYIPKGVNRETVYSGAEWFINKFYSLNGILARSFNTRLGFNRRAEFILFNLCYSAVYRQWLKAGIFKSEKGFEQLLKTPLKKSTSFKVFENLLNRFRGIKPGA